MEICRYVFAVQYIHNFFVLRCHYSELNVFLVHKERKNMKKKKKLQRNCLNKAVPRKAPEQTTNPKKKRLRNTLIEIILKISLLTFLLRGERETSRRIIKSLWLRCSKYVQNHKRRRLLLLLNRLLSFMNTLVHENLLGQINKIK